MCTLDGARGAGSRFDDARIEDSSVKGADLSQVSLRRAGLTETSFDRALLHEALLDRAHGDDVQFRGADMTGVSMVEAHFDEADFRGADLRRAKIFHSRFQYADFRGALLDGVNLGNSDCAYARFDDGAGPHDSVTPVYEGERSDETLGEDFLQGLAGLQGAFTAGGVDSSPFFEVLQRVMSSLESAGDDPPEEWKELLEPLMGMGEGRRPFNDKALFRALSVLLKCSPRESDGP
jgi:uncharacterized protein YjbI with pentapeptide repeats